MIRNRILRRTISKKDLLKINCINNPEKLEEEYFKLQKQIKFLKKEIKKLEFFVIKKY